jgi:hypothetical protein
MALPRASPPPARAARVAHQLIDHPNRDAGTRAAAPRLRAAGRTAWRSPERAGAGGQGRRAVIGGGGSWRRMAGEQGRRSLHRTQQLPAIERSKLSAKKFPIKILIPILQCRRLQQSRFLRKGSANASGHHLPGYLRAHLRPARRPGPRPPCLAVAVGSWARSPDPAATGPQALQRPGRRWP